MYSELITLLDKGGNVVVLSALTVGFYFLKRKIEDLCRRVARLEELLIELLRDGETRGGRVGHS